MKTNIREYAEEIPVEINISDSNSRLVIDAWNEAGFNGTNVDLMDVLRHVKENMPDVWDVV